MSRQYTARTIGKLYRRQYATAARPPLIRIHNGTFYRQHPNVSVGLATNPPLFKDLNFELPSFSKEEKHWAIIGPSSAGKTTFLQVLRGKHISIPPAARSWPFLESDEIESKDHRLRNPHFAIKLVGFDGEQGLGAKAPQSAYLSARYESRRENTDFSVLDYLQGNTELNAVREEKIDAGVLEKVVRDLRLGDLVDMPVSNLSNGQTRRARIARALLSNPEVLLLDEPFMGLDPPTLLSLSPMLHRLATANAPRLVLSLRPQDPIPDWITDLVFLKGNCEVAFQGKKEEVLRNVNSSRDVAELSSHEIGRKLTGTGIVIPTLSRDDPEFSRELPKNSSQSINAGAISTQSPKSRDGYPLHDLTGPEAGEPLVEMEGARVNYGSKVVLGNWRQDSTDKKSQDKKEGLWWTVRRGERWGVFGPNGSGKTTLLSLICSDHPQTYSLPIRLFGRSRLPEPGKPGISIFDLQSRIGHSSPEIHNHIPRSLTLRQVLENAWADTFRGIPRLNKDNHERINSFLNWFQQDLAPFAGSSGDKPLLEYLEDERENYSESPSNSIIERLSHNKKPSWADDLIFGQLPLSAQRVVLFLRAIIKQPDLVILDEAFSGMDDAVRDRCLLFLAHGQTKRFSYKTLDSTGKVIGTSLEKRIVKSEHAWADLAQPGLNENQALLCISHVREEIPGSVREWICLPEANTGKPARVGRLNGPLAGDEKRWNEIWGMA